MGSQRNILLFALALVSFLLYQQWQHPEPANKEAQRSAQSQPLSNNGQLSDEMILPHTLSPEEAVIVHTDVLTVAIDLIGGDLVSAKLNQYAKSMSTTDPFVLLEQNENKTYIAQSGLFGPQGIDLSSQSRPHYQTGATHYELKGDQLEVPLEYTYNNIHYTKTFIFKAGHYDVDLVFKVDNQSDQNATFAMYTHLRQTISESGGSLAMPTYRGGAYSTRDNRYKKYSFSDMKDDNLFLEENDKVNWVGMLEHYFASAWIARDEPDAKIYSRILGNLADIGIKTPSKTLAPNTQTALKATLWMGPKLQDQMEATAPYLDLSVDYGWLWFIAKPLHWLLDTIEKLVHNWGLAIVIMTLVVRGAMFPLTKAQYSSMAKMRMLQPKLQAMRERYENDKQKLSQEMMNLYKQEKVNPLGGCLPLLVQMPVFIAFYWALMESVELRHAPFFGWINDLSSQDPYYILPVLMGLSMFLLQKMSPNTMTDPMQQKIMSFMPVVFTFFFLWFPSGLVLYWLVSNLVSMAQQWFIYRSLAKVGLHSK